MQSPATATLSLGRCFLGAATMASGVLQLVTGEFVRLVPWWPAWLPVKAAWPYLVGGCLVVIGFAVLSGRRARTAATLLGAMILAMVLLLWPHRFIWNPVVDALLTEDLSAERPAAARRGASRRPMRRAGPSR